MEKNVLKAKEGREPWNKGIKFSKKDRDKIYSNRKRHKKFSIEEQNIIIERYKNGESAYRIAKDYPVSHKHILSVVRKTGQYSN